MLTSTGMIASVLYANEDRVLPVETHLVVMFQTTLGSFSTLLPLILSTFLYRLSRMVRLLILAWTLPLRLIGREESMYDLVFGTETGHMLAGRIRSAVGYDGIGSPKRHLMFCLRNLTICCPMTSENGTASTYLVR